MAEGTPSGLWIQWEDDSGAVMGINLQFVNRFEFHRDRKGEISVAKLWMDNRIEQFDNRQAARLIYVTMRDLKWITEASSK